jgi:hypothetical protein
MHNIVTKISPKHSCIYDLINAKVSLKVFMCVITGTKLAYGEKALLAIEHNISVDPPSKEQTVLLLDAFPPLEIVCSMHLNQNDKVIKTI